MTCKEAQNHREHQRLLSKEVLQHQDINWRQVVSWDFYFPFSAFSAKDSNSLAFSFPLSFSFLSQRSWLSLSSFCSFCLFNLFIFSWKGVLTIYFFVCLSKDFQWMVIPLSPNCYLTFFCNWMSLIESNLFFGKTEKPLRCWKQQRRRKKHNFQLVRCF